jgi:uncharacterized phage protein (TIGR01671 family)
MSEKLKYMSREIKFRAWSSNLKKLSKPFTLKASVLNFTNDEGLGNIKSIEDEIVQQFTGLKDKDGKEIYEGDILDNRWVVFFNDGMFGVFDKHHYMGLNSYMSKFRKVIGNIHENPELLYLS